MKVNKNIKKLVLVFAVLVALCLPSCGEGNNGQSTDAESSVDTEYFGADGALIVGTWNCMYDGKTLSFTFGSDGKGSGTLAPQTDGLGTVNIKFKFENNLLTIVSYPPDDWVNALDKEEYDAKVEDDVLYMRPLGSDVEYYKFYPVEEAE